MSSSLFNNISGVSIEAWLFRPNENVASFKSGAGSGLIVLASTENGNEHIQLPVPAGFGRYNVYLHVIDTLTGQTELSSNSVPLIYDSPRISTYKSKIKFVLFTPFSFLSMTKK